MKIKPPNVITFRLAEAVDGDYRVRTLDIAIRRRVRVMRASRSSLDTDGLDYVFHPTDDLTVRLSWLEYDDAGCRRACAPDIDLGGGFDLLVRGADLLSEIGEIVQRRLGHARARPTDDTFADPDVVLDALRHSRLCVEVERYVVDERKVWIESVPFLEEGVA